MFKFKKKSPPMVGNLSCLISVEDLEVRKQEVQALVKGRFVFYGI